MESLKQGVDSNDGTQMATCSKEDKTEHQKGSIQSIEKKRLPTDNSWALEAKFSREAEKIIKLRVTADNVNWELKQRVKDLEALRERQQLNLIQLQMQYEALDTKYQYELRLRENIVNKIVTTRSICQVVESHVGAAISTLAQCEQDRQTLSDAYEQAAQAIHRVNEMFNMFQQRQQIVLQAIQDKYDAEVRLKNECDANQKKVIKTYEERIEELKEQIGIQYNFNDSLKLQKEDAANLAQKTAQQNKELTVNLNQKIEELNLLKSEYIGWKDKYNQCIVNLEAAVKEKDVISVARENEIENSKMVIRKKNQLIEESEAAHNETKRRLEETLLQLQSIQASWKKQVQETSELETQLKSAITKKTEELNLLSETLKDSQNKLGLLQQHAECLMEQTDAYRKKTEDQEEKYDNDISTLQANVTVLTEQLKEKTEVVSLLEEKKTTADKNVLSLHDTVTSLMSQLKSSTESRGKLEKAAEQIRKESQIFEELQSENDQQKEREIQLLKEKISSIKSSLDAKIEHCTKIQNENALLQKELTTKEKYTLERDLTKLKSTRDAARNNSPLIGSTTTNVEKKREKIHQNDNKTNKRKVGNSSWKMPLNPNEINSKPTGQRKKPMEVYQFLSDSSYDGYVYDMETVKKQFRDSVQSRQPTSTSVTSRVQMVCVEAPFSDDPAAVEELARCDYTTRVTQAQARCGETQRLVRVYVNGIYDMFHQGHARQLKQAKNIFPNVYLIVGVYSDALTHSKKGRTVLTDEERYDTVRHCRYVDEVIRDAPWELNDEFIEAHKLDFVAHDEDPYLTEDGRDMYGSLKAKGMFVATQRTEGVSTFDIVARIVKDYDIYVRGNLAKGYSPEELNVSFVSEKKFQLQTKMAELKDKGKKVMTNIGERKAEWGEKSRNFIQTFLSMFGWEGRLFNIWNVSKGRLMQALRPSDSPDSEDEDEDLGDKYTQLDEADSFDEFTMPSTSQPQGHQSPDKSSGGSNSFMDRWIWGYSSNIPPSKRCITDDDDSSNDNSPLLP